MSTDVRGRIAIDVQFWDRTSAEGLQSLKTIALQDSTEYTSGKVAVVTGTVGTTSVRLNNAIPFGLANAYRDSAGNQLGLMFVRRVALQASSSAGVEITELTEGRMLVSRNDEVAVGNPKLATSLSVSIACLDGTSSYTVVLYGT